jgi:hypothetical protein
MNFIEVFGRMIDRITKRPILVDSDGRLIINQKRQVSVVSSTVAAAGNYDAEDVVSNSATESAALSWAFPIAPYPNGQAAIVKAQLIFHVTAQTPRCTLYLYSAEPACTHADNAANTGPTTGDIPIYIGRIDFPGLEDLGGMSESIATPSTYGNLPLEFTASDPNCKIYGILVLRDAFTNETAAQYVTIKLTVADFN